MLSIKALVAEHIAIMAEPQRASRYARFMVRDAEGKERPLHDPPDGIIILSSLDGDFPIRIQPLRLKLTPVKLVPAESSKQDAKDYN